MSKTDIHIFQENLRLKKEFLKMELDLKAVMDFMPYNLEIENRRLQSLLNFVKKYKECENRKTMELLGMMFPPVFPMISPESDWHRFELWIQGKAVRKKLRDQLSSKLELKSPNLLTDDQAPEALKILENVLEASGFGISLNEGIPPKLVYEFLWETLEEVFEISGEGGWFLDGCSGYCPGCFQRPWCESGQKGTWQEDEKAGKMDLIESVKKYVSAAPNSLAVLVANDDTPNFEMKPIEKNQDSGFFRSPLDFPGINDEPPSDSPINLN